MGNEGELGGKCVDVIAQQLSNTMDRGWRLNLEVDGRHTSAHVTRPIFNPSSLIYSSLQGSSSVSSTYHREPLLNFSAMAESAYVIRPIGRLLFLRSLVHE